ncbi:Alkaline_phosphatase [Hexamita inflata]|uniref:Alkaline phosphatase n=1 Tax=Hexamita inflata TaxID=28002 RepID=A0AA86QZC5_9EUKA|nr:Alkaline phosphatase [Hexamita inflata]
MTTTACATEQCQTTQKTSQSKQKYDKYFMTNFIALVSTLTIDVPIIVYASVMCALQGMFILNGILGAVSFLFTVILCIIEICQRKSLKNSKLLLVSTIIQVTLLLFSIAVGINTIVFYSSKLSYGPLAFIHEDKTRIHWGSNSKSNTVLNSVNLDYSEETLSRYHSVVVDNNQEFSYQIMGKSKKYDYSLPPAINKFVVLTDIHSNNRYLSNMATDYDFCVLCGDYSNSGKYGQFQQSFVGMPQKPILAVVGNHDFRGDYYQFLQRTVNFYQQVRNLGFFYLWVQEGDDAAAFQFLNDNAHLAAGDEHVFIVVHHPIYSTGEFGADIQISQQMEQFIDSHSHLKFRAVFSGHDHQFSAFKRNEQYFFVTGAGGGKIDQMTSKSFAEERQWPAKELHGPLAVLNDECYGYEHHIDSWMQFTRTEVNFYADKIVYQVRNLKNNNILASYEQDI